MPITKNKIADQFKECNNLKSFAHFLNELYYSQESSIKQSKQSNLPTERPIIIKRQTLCYFLYKHPTAYHSFAIAKKSGGKRVINAPVPALKRIQRMIKMALESIYTPLPQVTGFVAGKNIVDNARLHLNKKYVYNIDLKDFFPSISWKRIWAVLGKVRPFKINNEVARIIANLCTYKGTLPQGAPTSPILSNMVCLRLDLNLYRLSKKMKFTYSRYADDITISCNHNIFIPSFRQQLFNIIKREGFEVNERKERLQTYNVRQNGKWIREQQRVTGIVVNKKLNLPRHYIRNLRAMIHNWQKYGYQQAAQQFIYYYQREKGFIRNKANMPSFERVVAGKLAFLGMVRGKEDPIYQLLKLKFNKLCTKPLYSEKELKDILEIWQKEGIDAAMKQFYRVEYVNKN